MVMTLTSSTLTFAKHLIKCHIKKRLHKLHNYRITGQIYNWVKDFLADRKQRVIINGSSSEWINITSGLP